MTKALLLGLSLIIIIGGATAAYMGMFSNNQLFDNVTKNDPNMDTGDPNIQSSPESQQESSSEQNNYEENSDGKGEYDDIFPDKHGNCPDCTGSGWKMMWHAGKWIPVQGDPCPTCNGTGSI